MAWYRKIKVPQVVHRMYEAFYRKKIREMAATAHNAERIDDKWFQLLCHAGADIPSFHTEQVLRAFLSEERIRLEKRAECEANAKVSLICVEKDSLIYLKHFLPYYRKLGVKHFVFIDNGSKDGSKEYLEGERDVSLYSAPFPFEHHVKVGWILQAIQEIGTDQWYLRMDSDEFLSWVGMEDSTLEDLIAGMKLDGSRSIRAIMLDMYPGGILLEEQTENSNFLDEYTYFDNASSYHVDSRQGYIYGGMRKRLMGSMLRMDKYILFNPGAGQIPVSNHDISGGYSAEEQVCKCALLHYKFLSSDRAKYERIATDKNSGYSKIGELKKYRKILENQTVALADCSVEYISSQSLSQMSLIKE